MNKDGNPDPISRLAGAARFWAARLLSCLPRLDLSTRPRLREFLRAVRLCLFVGFSNLTHNRSRFLVAVAGASVPILFLTLQMAFLSALQEKVTKLYNMFDFDIAIVSDGYQFLDSGSHFDKARLSEALAVPGVANSSGINIDSAHWINLANGRYSPVLVIGLNGLGQFLRDPAIREGFPRLTSDRDVLVDSFSSSELGSLATGTSALLGKQNVQIAGHFSLGLFFYGDGSVIVPNSNFSLFSLSDPQKLSMGLVKISKGADLESVRRDLAAALPQDVRVLTRQELMDSEETFFLTTKPIGIMFRISMLIAFVVGSVILLQVLSVEIVNRTREFATMKAMGFSPAFVLGIGLCEILGTALCAFLAALLVSAVILGGVERLVHMATAVSMVLAISVLGIVLAMCLTASVAVVRRIWQADAAELY